MAANTNLREVITLQVGNYSNFIGSHFWNLQEALEHQTDSDEEGGEITRGVLYREGLNINAGKTYRPRAICFDLRENISNCRLSDDLIEDATPAWEGTVEKYDRSLGSGNNLRKSLREIVEKNANMDTTNSPQDCDHICARTTTRKLRNLDDVVSSWLDYSVSHLYDKSLHIVENSHHDVCQSFDNFGRGELLFQSPKFLNDFEDKLHFFAEECDRLQGFQILTDIHNSFGGLTSGILQELAEEYTKKCRLCFVTMPATFLDDSRAMADQRILNILLAFARYMENCSQIVPLCLRNSFGLRNTPVSLPWLQYEHTVDYQTSGILAAGIDTITLPYRSTDLQATDMNTFINNISTVGHKIPALSLGLPIPASSTFTLKDLLKGYESFTNNFVSLTPEVNKPNKILAQSVVIRGVPSHLLKKSDFTQTRKQVLSVLQSGARQYSLGWHNTHIAHQPCILNATFPDVFKPCVTSVGCVIESYQRPQELGVHRTSVMTSLQNCDEVGELLKTMLASAKQANGKYPGFLEAGIELDDIKSSLEDIQVMAQAFQPGYEL